MNQILILTRNVLAEQDIQKKLQSLNYEVYCSAIIFNNGNQQFETLEFFKFFQYVILSESICESEMTTLVLRLKEYPLSILRKVDVHVTAVEQKYLETEKLNAIISTDDSVDELRECLYNLKKKMGHQEEVLQKDNVIQLSGKVSLIQPNSFQKLDEVTTDNYLFVEAFQRLSPTEEKILSILVQAENQIVTRETICHQIWEEEVNKSHLASLSSTITRIKGKFAHTSLEKSAVHTLWGKGYRINQELLRMIQSDDTFNRLVLNG